MVGEAGYKTRGGGELFSSPDPTPASEGKRGSGDIQLVFLVMWVDFYVRGHM